MRIELNFFELSPELKLSFITLKSKLFIADPSGIAHAFTDVK